MSRLLCASAALAGALCLGAGPRAGEVGLLYWAAPGCPGEATFRERVADLYDLDDPFTPASSAAPSTLDVAITAEGNGYRATMIHRDKDGTELARSTERDRNCNVLVFVVAHRMRLAIAPRPQAPARVEVGPNDLDLSQFVGLLTPCGRCSVFFGCGVARAGVQLVHDSNYGALAPGLSPSFVAPLLQLGARADVEVPLGESPFAIRGWGEVLYSTPSTGFNYDGGYSEDRPDVSGFFGVGFVMKFGTDVKGAR